MLLDVAVPSVPALDLRRLQMTHELTLHWHSGVATIEFEAFQPWLLMTLKPHLSFDGAIWGLLADPGADGVPHIGSAHLHRLPVDVLKPFERLLADELVAAPGDVQIVNVCLADARWQGEAHAALREHGQRHGCMNWLLARFSDSGAPGRQIVMLTRSGAEQRFSGDEASRFGWLAPHMMLAYALRRKQLLSASQTGGRRLAGLAVAMVDRSGVVHDHHAGFLPMLRREWSDWAGTRLPEALCELIERRAGAPWRFLGQQVCAEFVPVDDIYLMTVRARHAADPLTPRESEVARRYAAGGSFREIATVLDLSPATVRSHLRNVFGKMQVRSKSQLAALLR